VQKWRSGQVDLMAQSFPDGLSERNINGHSRASFLTLFILTALMIAGLIGLLGGHSAQTERAEGEVLLKVTAPPVLRNGMFFETIVEVQAKQPLGNLVIGVSAPLWREMTINTMIPAAAEEGYMNGFHRFAFGKVDRGDVFRFKIDGQINPTPTLLGGTSGVIAAFDDEKKLTAIPIEMKVLP